MEDIKKRIARAEDDIKDLKGIWKTLTKIEKQNAVILSKFDEGHTCVHESELQSLMDFKDNAKEDMKNSISRTQAVLMVVFTGIITFLLGFIAHNL
jgi:hypothetical protein